MKRIFKVISVSLVMIFSFITITGCFWSNKVTAKYVVNVTNEDGSVPTVEMDVQTTIIKKLREPAGTPCYRKNSDNKLELVGENETGVYKCYDSQGKLFERATYDKAESEKLENRFPIYYNETNEKYVYSYESEELTIKNNDKYPLIYNFRIENEGESTIYIKKITLLAIFGDTLKDDTLKNIEFVEPEVVLKNKTEYYKLNKNSEININITLKNIDKNSFVFTDNRKVVVNIPLVIYKEIIAD